MTSAPAGERPSSVFVQGFPEISIPSPDFEGRQGRPRGRLWQTRARNQPFQGLTPNFPGARHLPKRRTEPLRTSPPSCRGATQRVAWRSGLGQAAASTSVAIPGADSTFSRTSTRFSGRSSPAEAADAPSRPSCRGATQRVAWRSGLGQAAPSTAVAIPGAESTFSRTSARFSGRSSPAEAADRTSPHLSALMPRSDATRRVAKRARAGSAVDGCGNPGRGINLFKDFRPIFRALVACRSGGPNLSALMPRSDATGRVAKRGRAGSGVDGCGKPGRGINLFKALRPIFRALVACRSGGASLLPACGEKVRMRGRVSVDGGQSPKPLTPTLSPLKRGEGVLSALLRWRRRGRGRRSGFETGGHGRRSCVAGIERTKAEHTFSHMARHCWIFPAAPGRGAGHSRQGPGAGGAGRRAVGA